MLLGGFHICVDTMLSLVEYGVQIAVKDTWLLSTETMYIYSQLCLEFFGITGRHWTYLIIINKTILSLSHLLPFKFLSGSQVSVFLSFEILIQIGSPFIYISRSCTLTSPWPTDASKQPLTKFVSLLQTVPVALCNPRRFMMNWAWSFRGNINLQRLVPLCPFAHLISSLLFVFPVTFLPV